MSYYEKFKFNQTTYKGKKISSRWYYEEEGLIKVKRFIFKVEGASFGSLEEARAWVDKNE